MALKKGPSNHPLPVSIDNSKEANFVINVYCVQKHGCPFGFLRE